jgi:hypothetical protein
MNFEEQIVDGDLRKHFVKVQHAEIRKKFWKVERMSPNEDKYKHTQKAVWSLIQSIIQYLLSHEGSPYAKSSEMTQAEVQTLMLKEMISVLKEESNRTAAEELLNNIMAC